MSRRTSRPIFARSRVRSTAVSMVFAMGIVAACGADGATRPPNGDASPSSGDTDCWAPSAHDPIELGAADPATLVGTDLVLVAYDSFYVPDAAFDAFEASTGISVEVVTTADTGTMVSQSVLNVGSPLGDVMWGIDNTFLCRGLLNDVFVPYTSPLLSSVSADLQLDPRHRVTPVDYSDLCVNYRFDALDELDLDPPVGLDDLRMSRYASAFVTENPETSAPGMGLLLATIARYGDPGWQSFWSDMADGGIAVEAGWTEAYYGRFAPDGDRALVMSYATSPIAEVVFAESPTDIAPTAALVDSCFRSVEFAGVLAGTEHPAASALLIDFLLSPSVQESLPLGMFVYPANGDVALPAEFTALAPTVLSPLSIDPAEIEAGRSTWTERWTEIVLR